MLVSCKNVQEKEENKPVERERKQISKSIGSRQFATTFANKKGSKQTSRLQQ